METYKTIAYSVRSKRKPYIPLLSAGSRYLKTPTHSNFTPRNQPRIPPSQVLPPGESNPDQSDRLINSDALHTYSFFSFVTINK